MRKKIVVITGSPRKNGNCEENDISVMDGVRVAIERSAVLLKWNMVGEVLVPGVYNIGDIGKTDGCERAAALADKF